MGIIFSLLITMAQADQESPSGEDLDYEKAEEAGIVENKELIELSGVVAGGVNQDILWVHNDRENLPRLYALNGKGETVGTYTLDAFNEAGMMAGDWEDIARMPGKEEGRFLLCIGDIGNNAMERKEHRILVVSEPVVEPGDASEVRELEFRTFRFQYPDEYACNSECLLIHPLTGEIFIISKTAKNGKEKTGPNAVWSLPPITDDDTVPTAKLIRESIPEIKKDKGIVTGGDISSDGQHLILRTYDDTAYLWKLGENESLADALEADPEKVDLPKERGGEAIGFSFDKSKLYTVYDGKKTDRPLHVFERK